MPDDSVFLNDLRGCSFEQFVDFAFDRPMPASEKDPDWWWTYDDREELFLVVDPALQIEHARRLFAEPLLLRARFTPAQIEQGLWFLSLSFIPQCASFFAEHLWSKVVPLEMRIRAIRAMHNLYAKFFELYPSETATNMWWCLIAEDVIHPLGKSIVPRSDPDQEQVRLAMVETLERILQLDARHCQEAALHGLNHIATPEERASLIDPFLKLPRDEKLLAYARQCREGRTL